jgi:hypothetical protein
VERNTWKSVEAALACAAIITIIVIWTSSANDREREKARDCDLMGVALLNGKPYKCSRLAPDSPTPPDPGHGREGGNGG